MVRVDGKRNRAYRASELRSEVQLFFVLAVE
jgi:hypothetical protein